MNKIQRLYNLLNAAAHEIRNKHPFVAYYLVPNLTTTGVTLYTLHKNRIDKQEAAQRGVDIDEELRKIKLLLDHNNHDHDVEYELVSRR